jgi:hypothetical protein
LRIKCGFLVNIVIVRNKSIDKEVIKCKISTSSNGFMNRNIRSLNGILNRNIFYILGPCNIQEDMVVEHFKETSTLLDLRHKMETTHFVTLSGVILIFFVFVLVTLLYVI